MTVLLNGEKGQAYNISNRNSVVSIRDVAEMLAKTADVNVVFQNPTDIEKRSYNLMENSVLNAEKLEALGWRAWYGLKTGIEQTIEVLRNQ